MATRFLAQFVPSQAAQGWHTAQAAACERDGRVIVGVLIDMPWQNHTKGGNLTRPKTEKTKEEGENKGDRGSEGDARGAEHSEGISCSDEGRRSLS